MTIEEYVDPRSMPTPALAGGIVAVISGALFKSFGIFVPISSIVLSFMIGLVVFQSRLFKMATVNKMTKAILYIINSLIIFSVATGATSVLAMDEIVQKRPFFFDWTKQKYETSEHIAKKSQPFDLSISIGKTAESGFSGFLENFGIVQKHYQIVIKLVPSEGMSLQDVDNVKFFLPKNYFDEHAFELSPEDIEKGVALNVWSGFSVAASVSTKSGVTTNIFEYVDPKEGLVTEELPPV